jgi:hypothetical protein
MTERPILTKPEKAGIHQALRLRIRPDASEEAVAREWAQHWWDNHAMGFLHGDPVDAVTEVGVSKLHAIARAFEGDYRHMLDRFD